MRRRSFRSARSASPTRSACRSICLPKQIGNTEIVYVPLPAYSVHTHARAKDIVVDSLVWRLPPQRKTRAGVNLIGEIFPSDPIKIDEVLRKIGTHVNTHVPGPRWADYVAMVDGALNAPLHPFYSESVKRMKMKQGLPFVEGAPVGIDGTYRWILSLARTAQARPRDRRAGGDRGTRPRRRRDVGTPARRAERHGRRLRRTRVLARAPLDRSRRERPVSLDRRQRQPAGARRGSVAGRARLHSALRRELRRRDRGADRPSLRLRDRHDAAVRARQRARHPADLLHQRDRDALA